MEGTIYQLSTYFTRLVELRLIFDERDDEVWKSLLENVREKKWQVHLDGEAEWLYKGHHQLEESVEGSRSFLNDSIRWSSDDARSCSHVETP